MAVDIRGSAPLIQVFDMPTSVRFYCGVVGFELISQSRPGNHFDWCLLRLNGVELMLNTAYERDSRPAAPDPARVAAHADVSLFFGCPDVDATCRYLRAQGLQMEDPAIQSYGMKQLYVTDPDGYTLCFQWPASDEMRDQWRKWYVQDADDAPSAA
jgi:glyoxylase I family protein